MREHHCELLEAGLHGVTFHKGRCKDDDIGPSHVWCKSAASALTTQ